MDDFLLMDTSAVSLLAVDDESAGHFTFYFSTNILDNTTGIAFSKRIATHGPKIAPRRRRRALRPRDRSLRRACLQTNSKPLPRARIRTRPARPVRKDECRTRELAHRIRDRLPRPNGRLRHEPTGFHPALTRKRKADSDERSPDTTPRMPP